MSDRTKQQELDTDYTRIEVDTNLCSGCDLHVRKDLCRLADCTTIDAHGNASLKPAIYKKKDGVP